MGCLVMVKSLLEEYMLLLYIALNTSLEMDIYHVCVFFARETLQHS